ncbi:uncharacterized protein LOC143245211 [Tachypleus tridentatus]|uniref:uncharacterized protein LOC143245211 n=1 Tax=Tachypleus tridentatus TaxID=6853 RepID=UPI003FD4BF06
MDCSLNGEYFCEACSKRFSGPVPYKQHLDSENHKKKLKKQDLFKEVQSIYKPKCSLSPCDSPGTCKEIQYKMSLSKLLACTVCAVRFSGPESAEEHYNSIKHMKKLRNKQFLENEVMKQLSNDTLMEETDKPVKQDEDTSQLLSNQPVKLSDTATACDKALTLEHSEKQNSEAEVTSSSSDTEDIKSQLKCEICSIPSFLNLKETLAHYESKDHYLLKEVLSSRYFNNLHINRNVQSLTAKEDTKNNLNCDSHEGNSKICYTFDSEPSAPPEGIMNNNLTSSHNLSMKAEKNLTYTKF